MDKQGKKTIFSRVMSALRGDTAPVIPPDEPVPEAVPTASAEAPDAAPAPAPINPAAWKPLPESHTWKLWALYHADESPCPPLIFALDDIGDHVPLLTEDELAREATSFSLEMEQKAEQRVRLLQKHRDAIMKAMQEEAARAAEADENAQPSTPETPDAAEGAQSASPETPETAEGAQSADPDAAEPETVYPDPDLPADYYIHISRNGMMAWLVIFPPVGNGAKPSLDGIGKALGAAGVKADIDPAVVPKLLRNPPVFTCLCIAWGTPEVPGISGSIVEHFARKKSSEIVMDETGNVDYRAQTYVQAIKKGETICDIIPPSPGKDGMRVDGTVMPAAKVMPAKPPNGSNTSLTDDGNHLLASIDGHLEFSGGVFSVKTLLDIPGNVDYCTGNIDFHGDVHIGGDVRENFVVHATGCITIDGLVEAATIEADGDVVISKGVLGDNKALIRAQGSVRAKYLENCRVYAGKDVVADCIMASQVFSDETISVRTGRGTVIGGSLAAANLIAANILGSKAERKTQITLGTLPFVEKELQENAEELDAIDTELIELEARLRFLTSRSDPRPPEIKERSKLQLRRSVLVLKQDKLNKRQEELRAMEPDLAHCRLECHVAYPGVAIAIGEDSKVIDAAWVNCKVTYDVEEKQLKIT